MKFYLLIEAYWESPRIQTAIIFVYLLFLGILNCQESSETATVDFKSYSSWENYAGTKNGIRYSSNDQINKENVSQLKVAWAYNSKDKDSLNRSQNQCNPIVINGILYATSPKLKLLALNAKTGEEKWVFDPSQDPLVQSDNVQSFFKTSRGITFWEGDSVNPSRIFYTIGSYTYCINANTGEPISSFGTSGRINLIDGLDRDPSTFDPYITNSSPGIIFKNLYISGSRVGESVNSAPGHIRAYDVITGERKWIFHTIPHPGEKGYESWEDAEAYKKFGGANSWAGMSLDEENEILYVPTGSVSGDFYGGYREGDNLFANSLIALNANNGEYIWHFQMVHHDLWDRDNPANPNLVNLYIDRENIPAVTQITKQGYVFLFNRLTGETIYPIEEVAVPQNALPGEKPSPTQPIPTLPEPFARQHFSSDELMKWDGKVDSAMMTKFNQVKYFEMFTPPNKEGAWLFPGFDGGGEWGGSAVDPETGILYVNSTELPWSLTMKDNPRLVSISPENQSMGRKTYNQYCIVCHETDLKGNGENISSIENLSSKYDKEELLQIINGGINMMPPFNYIPDKEKLALADFILNFNPEHITSVSQEIEKEPTSRNLNTSEGLIEPYIMTGYNRFTDNNGYPGITPPWGTLNAVDLTTGKLLWKVPLGEYKELTEKGLPPTGTENYGGPVVTKGGLVFIAATKDEKIRAFDKDTGDILWEANLPAAGYATPAVYEIDGKQFVVIVCGGGKIGSKSGDSILAFALKD